MKDTYTNDRGANVTKTTIDGDRYQFDHVLGSAEGWDQYDTDQDASYFGVWVNMSERKTVTFCEGDVCTTHSDTEEIFAAELSNMAEFYGSPPPIATLIQGGQVTKLYDTDTAARHGR